MTPGQLEERYEAFIDDRKELFTLIQVAVNRGMAGDMLDPDELYETRDLAEPEWKREIAKIDAILPDQQVED